jgi:hypothetical protein
MDTSALDPLCPIERPRHEPLTINLQKLLKQRVRQLKFVSRLFTVLLSIASLVPVAMTLAKFETTKNIYKQSLATSGPKKGQTVERNAWAADSRVWPTVMYTAVGAVSIVFNFSVMIAYCNGIRSANQAAKVASVFSWTVLLANLGVWIAAAVIYRQQKDLNGKSNDLWGWTCSPAAQQIQEDFKDQVDFQSYCNTQVRGVIFPKYHYPVSILIGSHYCAYADLRNAHRPYLGASALRRALSDSFPFWSTHSRCGESARRSGWRRISTPWSRICKCIWR